MTPLQDLTDALRGARRRWARVTACEVAGRAVLGVCLVLGAAWAVAAWFTPGELPATVLWTTAGGVALLWTGVSARPLRRLPSLAQVARYVEERNPALEDRLTTALEVSVTGRTSPVAGLIVSDALARVAALDVDGLIAPARRRSAYRKASLAAVGVVLIAILAGPSLWRTARTLALVVLPQAVTIDVSPGDTRVVRGTPVEVTARVRGEAALTIWNEPNLAVTDETGRRALPMKRSGDAYVATVEARADFSYRVETPIARSAEHRVTVLHRPEVVRVDVHYEYPRHTGLAPRTDEDGGDVYAPIGTKVRIEVHTRTPVVSGRLELAAGPGVELGVRADGVLEGRLEVEHDDAYRIALADTNGLRTEGDTDYFVKVLADRPPDVRIVRPSADRRVTPLEEIAIEARAEDDYGLQSLELVYAVRGGAERVLSLGDPKGALTASGTRTLYLEELGVAPGDFITYYARARDRGRGKQATEARSDLFFLDVTPFGEEFSLAESQAMGGASGDVLDLASAQKEIIVATWRLQRRAIGGRSRTDAEALTAAQRELRQRVGAAATSGGGPQPRLGAVEGDSALARAMTAMQRAEDLLAAARLGEALAPEMEAYNELLRAEAQRRRSQIARGQGGGGGGSGRPGADLSTLFDRELRRQQQTNYETRNSTETREASDQKGALDRIKELARRQQDLNRQEEELARQREGLTEEEMKRRLERLTREQIALRQQAEELARELARQGQEAGRPDGQASDRREALQGAAEEMQRATSELRRQELGTAGTRGTRALEELRRLEALVEQQRPDAARRAFGEAQLEARQLAEAQRDLASEAGRTGVTDETRRRLAAEEEQLAERVENLQRALQAVAGSRAAGEPRQRAAEAARQLEREAVSEQMRQTAEALRSTAEVDKKADEKIDNGVDRTVDDKAERGDRGPRTADAGDQAMQAARALESLAESVGARMGDSTEVERLSESLRRTRDLQTRLDQLEQRIQAEIAREAEGAPRDGQAQAPGRQPGKGGVAGREGLQGLENEYRQALGDLRTLRDQLERKEGSPGRLPDGGSWTLSAPGTERFKQDLTAWDALRRGVTETMAELQTTLATRLAEQLARERLNVGGDDPLPSEYESLAAAYYEAIAAAARKP